MPLTDDHQVYFRQFTDRLAEGLEEYFETLPLGELTHVQAERPLGEPESRAKSLPLLLGRDRLETVGVRRIGREKDPLRGHAKANRVIPGSASRHQNSRTHGNKPLPKQTEAAF